MFKTTWYKLLAWSVASMFFFVLAVVVAAMASGGPTETQNMLWMQGMMDAMHTSVMGWSMENHGLLDSLLVRNGQLVVPTMLAGALVGILLRLRRMQYEKQKA